MVYQAKTKVLKFAGTSIDYVTFGKGERVLIFIPGLGDGLSTVKGSARILSFLYRDFARDYKVYIFSRINELPQNYTIKDMATDVAGAMEALELKKAAVVGISQGGMIAQHLAANFPQKVEKLVLAVTSAKLSKDAQDVVQHWIDLVGGSSYLEIMLDVAQHSYIEKTFSKLKWIYQLLGRLGKIKDKERFFIQAHACLEHNSLGILGKITCPTLLVGVREDGVLGVEATFVCAQAIPNSQIHIFEACGHALYEKAKDFNQLVLHFLRERNGL